MVEKEGGYRHQLGPWCSNRFLLKTRLAGMRPAPVARHSAPWRWRIRLLVPRLTYRTQLMLDLRLLDAPERAPYR
jgi:hypothetical protein